MEVISNYLIKSDDYFNLIELDEENKYQKYLEEKNFQNIQGKLLFDDIDNLNNSINLNKNLIEKEEITFEMKDYTKNKFLKNYIEDLKNVNKKIIVF